MRQEMKIDNLEVRAYTIPSDAPGGDGTRLWDKVTLVLVTVTSGGVTGIGYTYADSSTAQFIQENLRQTVVGKNPMEIPGIWSSMNDKVRDLGGNTGLSSMAISAVDTALWDLKARLLELPLIDLFGASRTAVEIYGSGGYVTYSREQIQNQFTGWAEAGLRSVKMKVGREPDQDIERVRWAREAIGQHVQLMVDANGAYASKQAFWMSERFAELGVVWFEEPVPADDLAELHLLRNRMPAPIEVAAGEYGSRLAYFNQMLEAQAVDVLQADSSRCGGYTAFLKTDALCQTRRIPLSAHCAPTLHIHVACTAVMLRHIEYFHDHVRAEHMIFDNVPQPRADGTIAPDRTAPGNGLSIKEADITQFRVY